MYTSHDDLSILMSSHERKSFEYEDELRALIWLLLSEIIDLSAPPPNGVNIHVDISRLIRTVCASPSRGSWFVDVVTSTLEKFGYAAIPVVQSGLYSLK